MNSLLILRNDAAEFGRLAEFAVGFAQRHGLADTEQARLLIVLEELFTNIVKHGYDAPPGAGRIEIAFGLDAGRLTIEISDDGRPFDPLARAAPDLGLPAEQREIGGLGIGIWPALVDEARYHHDGGRNHLVLARRLPGPNPPDDLG